MNPPAKHSDSKLPQAVPGHGPDLDDEDRRDLADALAALQEIRESGETPSLWSEAKARLQR